MKITISGLILLVLFSAAPLAAQRQTQSAAESELLRYIRGESADPACGVCLSTARRHLEDSAREKLSKRAAGMAKVPAGEYKIGAEKGKGEPDELPRHAVRLDAFYLDTREVTIAEYQDFVKATRGNQPEWAKPGGKFNLETGKDKYYRRLEGLIKSCPSCPVFGVFWEDADAYCRWKNKRLPTEAEWEAAAAAGSPNKYSFGDSDADAGDFSWSETNSGEIPHKAGSKGPNALGLYDMHGNVWEWVQDFYGKTYYEGSPKKNPKGPETGRDHVIRGGSWASAADEMAVTNRASYTKANDDIGFRCAVSESDLLREPGR
ncbi:MAG: SUMF1/EgtB/PvdO family nonheme iron enzyme [Elusimicrobiota bacterium]|nr:SUMF1/EgtB/PvdO family nonheme iron enzyme [Elusimicrobiota bacterium]